MGAPSYIQFMASLHDSGAPEVERPEPKRLVCVECRQVAKSEASGWRAYLTSDHQLAIYCPRCGERESGADTAA